MDQVSYSTPWQSLPDNTEVTGSVMAIGDVHGQADLLRGLMRHLDAADRRAGKASQIVFLGDMIDRGPSSLEVMDIALNAEHRGQRAIVLPGNHEGMLLDALRMPIEDGAFYHWYKCGGHSLVKEMGLSGLQCQNGLRKALRSALPKMFFDWIETSESHYRNGDLLFVHAGIPPHGAPRRSWQPAPQAETSQDVLLDFLAQGLSEASQYHWAWLREPFLSWRGGWDAARRMIVVHGHTIETGARIPDLEVLAPEMDRIATHRRINLDIGSSKFSQLAAVEIEPGRYRFHCCYADI